LRLGFYLSIAKVHKKLKQTKKFGKKSNKENVYAPFN
jgi:hypothetical protein